MTYSISSVVIDGEDAGDPFTDASYEYCGGGKRLLLSIRDLQCPQCSSFLASDMTDSQADPQARSCLEMHCL